MADTSLTADELIEAAAIALNTRAPRELAPTADLDADIKRLVSKYGAERVRASATRATKGKTGRKEERDWPLLGKVFTQDARDWLDGKNPFKIRSNYAVAVAFAKAHPGYSAAATQRRIMGKLARKRAYFFHVSAWQIGERERPFAEYFRAVDALVAISDQRFGKMIRDDADRHLGKLQRYRDLIGEPEPSLTIEQIEHGLDAALTSQSALAASNPINLLQRLAGLGSEETSRS